MSVKQLPGQLPKGANLDALLTPEQFAVWRNESPITVSRKLSALPGVIREGRKFARIHPRTYLEAQVRTRVG